MENNEDLKYKTKKGINATSQRTQLLVQKEEHKAFAEWLKNNAEESIGRLNKEIKKRTKVVGVFPNEAAGKRLIGSLLMEQHEEWMEENAYLTENETGKSAFFA